MAVSQDGVSAVRLAPRNSSWFDLPRSLSNGKHGMLSLLLFPQFRGQRADKGSLYLNSPLVGSCSRLPGTTRPAPGEASASSRLKSGVSILLAFPLIASNASWKLTPLHRSPQD